MLTRRSFVVAPSLVLAGSLGSARAGQGPAAPASPGVASDPPGPGVRAAAFPAQDLGLVREVVIAAHGNLARLRTLVDRQQTLAKAVHDWGFGDWESALAGAAHVGQREIAEYLIANGAQPTIFSAAMLGQLDVVKAFVAASPGIVRVRGPHSIPLLRHALAGGAPARPVVDYLNTVPEAALPPPLAPLTAADTDRLAGAYVIDGGGAEPVVIAVSGGQLTFALAGRSRGLRHAGALVFTPAGADNVRVVFAAAATGVTVTVHDPDVVLTARKPVKL